MFAERASDVLTAIAFGKQLGGRDVALAGRGRAGAWALAARALAGDAVARTAVDLGGFDFDQVRETTDEALLPGAVKYGGVRGPGVAGGDPAARLIAGAPRVAGRAVDAAAAERHAAGDAGLGPMPWSTRRSSADARTSEFGRADGRDEQRPNQNRPAARPSSTIAPTM